MADVDRGLGTMQQDGFEEWRDAPSKNVLLTVDHNVGDSPHELVIGVGDEHHVVWLTKDDALWLRERSWRRAGSLGGFGNTPRDG